MAAGDKCIGHLTLDIKDISDKVNGINALLASIGQNIKIDDAVEKGINQALQKLVNEAKNAGAEAKRAMEEIGGGKGADKAIGKIASQMELVTGTVKTYVREIDKAGNATMQLAQTVTTGMDQAGRTIKEFSDASGNITKRTEAVKKSMEEEEDLAWKSYEAFEEAENKKAEAAVEAGLKRDEAAQQSAQKALEAEQTRIDKEVAMMEESVAKEQEALEKQIANYEAAEEKKRQASIESEFEREEARKKALQAEEELIAKEVAMMEESVAKQQEVFQAGKVQEAENAYKRLSMAIKEYNTAKQAGNEEMQNYWQQQIQGIMDTVSAIEQSIPALNLEESAMQAILDKVNQCKTAQSAWNAGITGSSASMSEIEGTVTSVMTRMFSLMAVVRTVSGVFQNMVEYVSEYSDKMSEIQMITLKSSGEINQLADKYRQIAQDMSVSSLDIADAAIYFTRQGLGAAEIEDRLKNTTQYAKAANIEFEHAAELITAVVNSMNLVAEEAEDGRSAAERVADVFLKIGDSAATSGEEIGEAMQKAAVSAGTFGVSFEWLASAIATVSETTRQEARTIGTAFNTIIARLHSIKQNGYNSEDETKLNDISKALAKINVELMDQDHNWRDMEDIWGDIAAQWDTLNDKQKSYIATTMAGVKQQNVFFAAMNNMEKGGRFWELYDKAIDSAGTSTEKYAVYLDSVEASQERLNVAQEKFYSLLGQDAIKTWNNSIADFVNMINSGSDALDGWNIKIPLIVAGIVSIIAVIKNLGPIMTSLGKHPVVLTIAAITAGVVALVAAISKIGEAIGTAEQRFNEASSSLNERLQTINRYTSDKLKLTDMFSELKTAVDPANGGLEKYEALLSDISAVSPEAKQAVEDFKAGLITQEEAAQKLTTALEEVIAREKEFAALDLMKELTNATTESITADSFMFKYSNWDPYLFEGDTDRERYLSAMKKVLQLVDSAKSHPELGTGFEERYLGEEVATYAKALIESYKQAGEEVNWDNISMAIWTKFVNAMSYGPTDVVAEKVSKLIDDAMNVVSINIDPVKAEMIRDKLMNAMFDSEGKSRYSTVESASLALNKMIREFYEKGFDPDKILAPLDKVRGLAKRVFEDEVPAEFMRAAEAAAYKNDSEFGEKIIQAYESMIASGMDEAEVNDFLKRLPMDKWENMVEEMKARLIDSLKDTFEDEDTDAYDLSEILSVFGLKLDDLDVGTLDLFKDLAQLGYSIDDLGDAFEGTESFDEFIEKLKELRGEVEETSEELSEEEAPKSVQDLVKEIKEATKAIEEYDKLITSIDKGEKISLSDILDLAANHPSIIASINDINNLRQAIAGLKTETSTNVLKSIQEIIRGSAEAMASSPFASYMKEGGPQNLNELYATGDEELQTQINHYVDVATASFLAATDKLGDVNKDIIGQWMTSMFDDSNVDLLNRKVIQVGEDIATVLTQTFTAGDASMKGLEWSKNVVINLTPITPDGELLDQDTVDQYIEDLLSKTDSIEGLMTLDKVENGGKGLLINVEYASEGFDDAVAKASSFMELLHLLQEAYYGAQESEKTWLQQQYEEYTKVMTEETAKTNEYIDQLTALNEAANSLDFSAVSRAWEGFGDLQSGIIDMYKDDLLPAMVEYEDALNNYKQVTEDASSTTEQQRQAAERLRDAMRDLANVTGQAIQSKGLSETSKMLDNLRNKTVSLSTAYEHYNKVVEQGKKAQDDITKAYEKLDKGAALTTKDVEALATALGKTPEEVLADFPKALDQFKAMQAAIEQLGAELRKEMILKIFGTSEGDFSDIENGLIAVEGLAEETVQALMATGQWEKEDIELPQEGYFWNPFTGWKRSTITAHQTVLKPKGAFGEGTTGGDKTGGGGGGGGGGKKEESVIDDATQQILDKLADIKKYQDAQIEYYEALAKYYEGQGYWHKAVEAYEKELEALQKTDRQYDRTIKQIEDTIAKKKEEMAATEKGSEEYNKLKKEIEALETELAGMKTAQLSVKTSIESTTDAIKKQKNAVRDYTAEIKDLIYQAVEAKHALQDSMLEGRITMEQTIVSILSGTEKSTKAQAKQAASSASSAGSAYDSELKALQAQQKQIEKNAKARLDALKDEYDAFQKANKASQEALQKEYETYNKINKAKIEALNEEKSLLSQQLNLRKQMADKENKQAELNKLEAQYQRIVADPTRAKEAQSLNQKIADLRKELAWDAAEEEVKAKQDSLDQQKKALEKDAALYKEAYDDKKDALKKELEDYKENYEAKKKMIEDERDKMKEALQAQIDALQELKSAQSEAASSYSEAAQASVTSSRQYADQLNELLQKSDKEIIKWLKEHSEDYQNATDAERKKMVKEWKAALKQMRGEQTDYWDEVEKIYKKGNKRIIEYLKKYLPEYKQAGKEQAEAMIEGWEEKLDKLKKAIRDAVAEGVEEGKKAAEGAGGGFSPNYSGGSGGFNMQKLNDLFSGVHFATGGLATSTGPAWLDGTDQLPERVLSPYQTQLFESMVGALEQMNSVRVNSMPGFMRDKQTGGNNFSVGDIIVQVENLDTDDDYEELAQKVSEKIMNSIGRRSVIGGIRLGSV